MRKIKKPKIGQYVLATYWCDKDPNDPWQIGFVESIHRQKDIQAFRLVEAKDGGNMFFQSRATKEMSGARI